MTPFTLLAALTALAASPGNAPLPDPLGPATEGRLQCYSPNLTRKTCQSLAGYARGTSGEIVNTALVLLAPDPVVTMETAAPVEVRDGAVCGYTRARDIEGASFAVAGQPVAPSQIAPLRQHVLTLFEPYLDREICSTYEPAGDTLVAKASLDGVATPALNVNVIWVAPDEGYSFGP